MHGARAGRGGDTAVTAVLGAILMLALLMTLVPGAILLRGALSDEMQAQREAAERAAWCARHPDVGPPACDPRPPPMIGYECREVGPDVWVCAPPGTEVPAAPAPP